MHVHYACTFTALCVISSCILTGSPMVTTPCSLTTLGWWNWPIMAASCRNFTLSSSEVLSLSVLIATGTDPVGVVHTPLLTVPNCPDPK